MIITWELDYWQGWCVRKKNRLISRRKGFSNSQNATQNRRNRRKNFLKYKIPTQTDAKGPKWWYFPLFWHKNFSKTIFKSFYTWIHALNRKFLYKIDHKNLFFDKNGFQLCDFLKFLGKMAFRTVLLKSKIGLIFFCVGIFEIVSMQTQTDAKIFASDATCIPTHQPWLLNLNWDTRF